MGWYYTYNSSMRDQIAEITQNQDYPDGNKLTCLARKLNGMTLWTVWERTMPDKPPYRFIGCYLIRKGDEGSWGYKPLDEYMGPAEYSCPLSYLDMAPLMPEHDSHGWSAKWREGVKNWHAVHNAKWAIGQKLLLWNGKDVYYVQRLKPFRVNTSPDFNGYEYRAKKSQFTAIQEG